MFITIPQKEIIISNITDDKQSEFFEYLKKLFKFEEIIIKKDQNGCKIKFENLSDALIAFDLLSQEKI